ncbi:hypothetical protein [Lentibacter sp.]|uniref:hypothetical protein n=1 Tax=Lentibacter sp. TaxID=2024994 RepID=UPI003F6A36AE
MIMFQNERIKQGNSHPFFDKAQEIFEEMGVHPRAQGQTCGVEDLSQTALCHVIRTHGDERLVGD